MTHRQADRDASAWLARLDAEGRIHADTRLEVLVGENREFAEWLEGSIERRVAVLRLLSAWQSADRLAALNVENPASRATPWRQSVLSAAAAILLVAIVAVALWRNVPADAPELEVFTANLETETGERETASLPEGSRIELNTASRVSVRLDAQTRRVELQDGEAYFDVASEPARAFTVDAGLAEVIVLGTRFAIDRRDERVTLTVIEGSVRVRGAGGSAVLTAGRSAEVDADGRIDLADLSQRDLDRATAWRRGRIYFEDVPLSQVAEEFNRYNRAKLFVHEDVADIHIGGNFRTDNVEGFVALLSDGLGLTVERGNNVLYVTR